MPDHDPLLALLVSQGVLAYVGLGPGQEFIPYFLALLALVWAALSAVAQWPLGLLVRGLRKVQGLIKERGKTADVPGAAGEAGLDRQ